MSSPSPPLVALVGPHNSGKTGLVERLVVAACRSGYRVGVIKRAAQVLQIDPAGKDSGRFAAAGAERVVAVGPGRLMLTERIEGAPSLRSIRRRLGHGIDLWLAESYVPEPVPWLGVARSSANAPSANRYCLATIGYRLKSLPSFPLSHTHKILRFIVMQAGLERSSG